MDPGRRQPAGGPRGPAVHADGSRPANRKGAVQVCPEELCLQWGNLVVTLRAALFGSETSGSADRQRRHRNRVQSPPDGSVSDAALPQRLTRPTARSASVRAPPNLQTPTQAPRLGERATHPSLTRRQQSQHQVSKNPASTAHRQPHCGIAGLSQPAVRTPSGRQEEDSENYPTVIRPAATTAGAFPQFSALFPAVSTAPAAVPVRAVAPRRNPSPHRTGCPPSSPAAPARSPPASVRSSSRT